MPERPATSEPDGECIMHPLVREVEAPHLRSDLPYFRPGDTVRVMVRIVESGKERVQPFEGVVIARRGSGVRETFTVRRTAYNVSMERVFQLHSPRLEEIRIVRRGKVRRAKLYYLRDLSGKKARLTERRVAATKLEAEAEAGQKALTGLLAEEQVRQQKAIDAAAAAEAEAKAAEAANAEPAETEGVEDQAPAAEGEATETKE